MFRHRPDLVEGLNLVLLGKIGSGKSASGNTILGRQAFESKESFTSVTLDLAVESGTVHGRPVTVYDTPGLFNTKLSEEEIQQIYAKVLRRCESGPCVFLLVIKADRFTGKERQTVEKIEELLGEERLKRTWILFTGRDELEEENMSIDEFINETQPLRRLVQKYDQRYHVFNNKKKEPNGQVQELLRKIYATHPDTAEGGAKPKQTGVKRLERPKVLLTSEWPGAHVVTASPRCLASRISIEGGVKRKQTIVKGLGVQVLLTSEWPDAHVVTAPHRSLAATPFIHGMISTGWLTELINAPDEPDTSRRIVLLGKTGVGKSAAGNTILGRREFRSEMRLSSVTCVCSVAHATVSGRPVSVVDTPGFFHTHMNPEELVTEMARSVYMSSPGPHAFLIVIDLSVRFTEHEQQILQKIEMMFGQEVLKYSIILFTHGDQLRGESVEKLIEENSRLRDLVDQCGGRFHIFNNEDENNREQVNDLLQKIDTMIEQNGGGHYSNEIYKEEEVRKQQKKQRQEEIERVIKETEEKIRAEFEGPPKFLLERLKQMRLREEERRQQEEEFERDFYPHFLRPHMEMRRKQLEEEQRQEEIERVIKETEERIRAEIEGSPRFLQERFNSMRLREEERRPRQEELEPVIYPRLSPRRHMEMRRKQIEEQRQEEIERVIKETEQRIRAEFEGPPRFLQERLKQVRQREEERRQQQSMRQREEERIRRQEFERDFYPRLPSPRRHMKMRLEMRRKQLEEEQRQEEIEKVRKETEERIRAEFEGPPRFLQERLKQMRLREEERRRQELEYFTPWVHH